MRLLLLLLLCGIATQAAPVWSSSPSSVEIVDFDTATPLRTTDERFLSITIDIGHVPNFDFDSDRLLRLTQEVGPRSYVRVGGTKGDTIYYSVPGASPRLNESAAPPPGYKLVYTETQFDNLCAFVAKVGFKLVFGLNAGLGPRNNNHTGPWTPTNAEVLLRWLHTAQPGCIWGLELGNEPNLWPFNFGLFIEPHVLAQDFRLLHSVAQSIDPSWVLLGPDVAFNIPVVGELTSTFTDFMHDGGALVLHAATWHFYALESLNCPLHGWPMTATPMRAISPTTMAEDDKWIETVVNYTSTYGNGAQLWLGEMSEISCGGVLNISAAVGSTFYYLVKLGELSERGHDVVAKQELTSENYGLITENAQHYANPTYWAALLWTRLMDSRVLSLSTQPAVVRDTSTFRVFAHCTLSATAAGNTTKALFPEASGGVTVLVINFSPSTQLQVAEFGFVAGPGGNLTRYDMVVTPGVQGPTVVDTLTARSVRLNSGPLLVPAADGSTPPLRPEDPATAGSALQVPALSYAFAVFPFARVKACA